jgi:hypothetical protein
VLRTERKSDYDTLEREARVITPFPLDSSSSIVEGFSFQTFFRVLFPPLKSLHSVLCVVAQVVPVSRVRRDGFTALDSVRVY